MSEDVVLEVSEAFVVDGVEEELLAPRFHGFVLVVAGTVDATRPESTVALVSVVAVAGNTVQLLAMLTEDQ